MHIRFSLIWTATTDWVTPSALHQAAIQKISMACRHSQIPHTSTGSDHSNSCLQVTRSALFCVATAENASQTASCSQQEQTGLPTPPRCHSKQPWGCSPHLHPPDIGAGWGSSFRVPFWNRAPFLVHIPCMSSPKMSSTELFSCLQYRALRAGSFSLHVFSSVT